MDLKTIVARCQALYDDIGFSAVRDWKEEAPGRKAIGFMPIYVPREILHAAGILPVGVMGADMEIIRGDAYYQSYICHIPRSTVELGLTGRLDVLDGMIFPSICDVIRNLSGMWRIMFPEKLSRYLDLPQSFQAETGGRFYRAELASLQAELAALAGNTAGGGAAGGEVPDNGRLLESIALYNRNRALTRELYALRAEAPWQVPTSELYLLLRAGNLLPVETHNDMLEQYRQGVERAGRTEMDNSRVVLTGAFCEQPPLGLIRTIERAGCYIVDDDFVLGSRWIEGDVAERGDGLDNLVEAFLERSTANASIYIGEAKKGEALVRNCRGCEGEGIIFCAPSFCDPALLEQPMLQKAADAAEIPYTEFKYAENTGQFQVIKEQTGTFSDAIKLWGNT